jgi:hypothetical protein
MKKEAPLKMQGAQKSSDEKRGTPKSKALKRPLMKKEAPLKANGAKKYLHLEGRLLHFKRPSSGRTHASFQMKMKKQPRVPNAQTQGLAFVQKDVAFISKDLHLKGRRLCFKIPSSRRTYASFQMKMKKRPRVPNDQNIGPLAFIQKDIGFISKDLRPEGCRLHFKRPSSRRT